MSAMNAWMPGTEQNSNGRPTTSRLKSNGKQIITGRKSGGFGLSLTVVGSDLDVLDQRPPLPKLPAHPIVDRWLLIMMFLFLALAVISGGFAAACFLGVI
jgi:hypothetical protein